jgi:signal transduction histidine kinase/ligand-binding sensor domain-containing protein/CheY-like chemotaxis protein/AraC-like DNA-binding protein
MKRYKKQLYIFGIFLIVFFQSSRGQSSYIFHHLDTKDGLSNNSVKTVLRDSYGFLWIGTEAGLNRYDGYGFHVYSTRLGIPTTLVTNDIIDLQEDGLGNIWVYFGYTYMVYDRDKDCFNSNFKQLLLDLGIQSEDNSKVFVDKKHNLWVFNKRNVSFYNVQKKTTATFNLKIPFTEAITTNITDNRDYLYTILKTGACWQMNKNTGAQVLFQLPDFIKPEIANGRNRIYADSNNGLWFSSSLSDQILYKKSSSQQWEIINLTSEIKSVSNVITSIIENQTGQIWIGTDHKGIFIYDRIKNTITNIVNKPSTYTSLSSNSVQFLYRDNNETIWIGHNKKGLSFYHESFRNFINFKHPECSDITTIMEDYLGNIWLGTDGNGVYVKPQHSENNVKKLPIPNTAIVSMIEDRKGRVWIGTYMKGLFCYEKGKIVQYTTKNSKLSSNDIWGLKEDRYGNIWIGTLGGKIQVLQSESKDFQSIISPFNSKDYALDMFYDGGDKMYIGTVYGLSVIDITNNKRITYYGNKRGNISFKQLKISNIYKDNSGVIWLGHSDGLTIWDQKQDTLYNFSKENGLCDNSIRGITEDNLKNIWVTTSNGLSILSVKRESNETLTFTSKNYSVKDGLKDTYFNNHSICKLRSGDILLGNVDGYSILNPNKMAEKDQPQAKVIFTGLTVGNNNIQVDSIYNGHKILENSMELTGELTFNYSDKLISLQFTTGDLLNSDKVKYVYQIEGFNTQWIPTLENKIIISSLPSGKYRLLIKACNSDGIWNNDPTVLIINVTPPFYASIWAFILYTFLVIGIVLYYIRRKEERHGIKLEQQRIQLDHEKEIHINEMKLRFFTNISHDLRTPLTLIITPLQILLNDATDENMRKKLGNIYKNAQHLLTLINSLLDFRKLDVGAETLNLKSGDFIYFVREIYASFCVYADERNIGFSLLSETQSLSIQFDQNKIQKTIANLLSNAFKYTADGGTIAINVYQQENYVCLSVSDTGPGISDEEKEHVFERFYQAPQKQEKTGSGIGLHIAYGYVHLHGGTIIVTDNMPKGSIFTFKIPIITADITENIQIEKIIDNEYDDEYICRAISSDIPKLLFVDDNKDLCEFIEDNLSNDYSVITACNGQDALDKLQKNDITIVVSDVMMPVMSGTELCKQIKTDISLSHIPVILLTARTAEEHKIEGLELGADDYITKPFNFNILKLRIQKFLEWTEKSHQAFSQKIDVSPAEITITSLDEKLIEKAIKVVEEHMSDYDFSVETLGDAVGLSRGHLYKKLMIITGKGPAEFIRTIRLKRGRQLLEKSQLQIAEIAYAVGYNSPKRFTVNFREEFGMSPSEYLRIHKQQE